MEEGVIRGKNENDRERKKVNAVEISDWQHSTVIREL